MVRYAVGYRSRAFVTFGAADRRSAASTRIRGSGGARAHACSDADASAGCTRCCRRRSWRRRCGRRSRGASSSSASTRLIEDAAAVRANLGVHSGRRGGGRARSSRSKRAASSSLERGRVPGSRSQRAAILRAVRIEHLLESTPGRTALSRPDGLRSAAKTFFHLLCRAARPLKRLASRYGMRYAAQLRAPVHRR